MLAPRIFLVLNLIMIVWLLSVGLDSNEAGIADTLCLVMAVVMAILSVKHIITILNEKK